MKIPSEPICVVGNLLTDLIVREVDQMPAWGEEVAGSGHEFIPSGQATYLTRGLSALGGATRVVGAVGDDPAGREIVASLERVGIDAASITVIRTGTTAISVAIVRPDGERAFVSDFACLSAVDQAFLRSHRKAISDSGTICLVGLLNLPALSLEAARDLLAGANSEGKTTVLDTGWAPGGWSDETVAGVLELLPEVDILLPNDREASALTGLTEPEAAAVALQRRGAKLVVVKCGPRGSVAAIAGEAAWADAYETRVHDTVGAGDCFNAGLLHALGRGARIAEAIRWANATASVYVSRSKDRFPSQDAVEALLAVDSEARPEASQSLRSAHD